MDTFIDIYSTPLLLMMRSSNRSRVYSPFVCGYRSCTVAKNDVIDRGLEVPVTADSQRCSLTWVEYRRN